MYLYTSPTTTDNRYRPLLSILAWPWHISTWLLIFAVWFCCSGFSSSRSFVFFDLVTTLTAEQKKKRREKILWAIYKYIWQFQILEDITCIIQLGHTEKNKKQDKPRKEKKIFEISITIDWKCCLFYTRYCCCCRFEFLLPRISTRTLRRYLKRVHRVFPLFQRRPQEIFVFCFIYTLPAIAVVAWPGHQGNLDEMKINK